MTTILLVDDDEQWRDILSRALPQYRVDVAASYNEALAFLTDGIPYDAAIVDLNLIPEQRDARAANPHPRREDRLGMDILAELRDNYPATRRIALTGFDPDAVKHILERYDVDCILHKATTSPADMRAAVKESIQLALADVPSNVRRARSNLGDRFSRWKKGRIKHFDDVARLRDDEINEARGRGQPIAYWSDQLAKLNEQIEQFESECPAFVQALSNARTLDAVAQVSGEFERLRGMFGYDGRS